MSIQILHDNEQIRAILSDNISKSNCIKIATGYFSYRIFELFTDEFKDFKNNEGCFQLVIGSDTDFKTIEFLKNMNNLSKVELLGEISELYFGDFKDINDETLYLVHELFKNRNIEIKVGVSKDGGVFHVKEYFFSNDGCSSYISGSLNFTHSATIKNHENVTYFKDHEIIQTSVEFFDKRWNNLLEKVTTIEIEEYLLENISAEIVLRESNSKNNDQIELRDYQLDAIDDLMSSDFNGFLEMATGTGKTFTTIYGLKKFLNSKDKTYSNLIVVPLMQLAVQWKREIQKSFGVEIRIIECYTGHDWYGRFSRAVDKSADENIFFIMVQSSFVQNMKDIMDVMKYSNNILIVDEAHNLTKDNLELMTSNKDVFSSKLGLSATPENYLDDERTELLFNLFKGTHFIFELQRAIEEGYLTEYTYTPTLVELSQEEENRYKELTRKVQEETSPKVISKLLDDRSKVLSRAKSKINEMIKIINKLDDISYTLVYCNPGSFILNQNEERKYIDHISIEIEEKTISKPKKRKITSTEPLKEREEIVRDFEENNVDLILAIKCLDEGYDIPAVRNAIILSSTRNPSEFVQRRGRVLRKFPGKKRANIYDFIVMVDGEVPNDEKKRFYEYYLLSTNFKEFEYFKDKYIGECDDE